MCPAGRDDPVIVVRAAGHDAKRLIVDLAGTPSAQGLIFKNQLAGLR